MYLHPKDIWNHVKILREGLKSHKEITNIMKFRNEDGNIAKNNADNAKIAGKHFIKVFNWETEVD